MSALVTALHRDIRRRIGVGALLVVKSSEAPHGLDLFWCHARRAPRGRQTAARITSRMTNCELDKIFTR